MGSNPPFPTNFNRYLDTANVPAESASYQLKGSLGLGGVEGSRAEGSTPSLNTNLYVGDDPV